MSSGTQRDIPASIADRLADFTGRAWVFDRLNAWLGADAPRTFVLTGEPGSGKSTLAARLVQLSQGEPTTTAYQHLRKHGLAYAHFCQARADSTLDPRRFVEALSLQVAARYQSFALALTKVSDQEIIINATQTVGTAERGAAITNVAIRELHIGDLSARRAFDRLVRRPLEQLCTSDFHETILVLVDALDEALTYDPDENLVALLSHITADLPRQVRFLLTARPDERVLHLIGQPSLDLLADTPQDVDDVRQYAFRRLHALAAPGRAEVADRVATAGKGNFLYVRHVVDDLLPRLDQGEDLSHLRLPTDLEDIYRQFLRRELGKNLQRWDELYGPVLGTLAVARGEGLTRTQLAGITGRPLSRVDSILRTCRQYVTGREPDGPFRLYHGSFRDFLLTENDYPVYPAEANQAIARFFLSKYQGQWLTCREPYLWEHLATHLAAAGQHEELQRLLVDFNWLWAKLRATDVNMLLADYEADKELAADRNLRLVQAAVRLSAHVLTRDPTQLPGQLVGRLLTYQQPVIQALLAQMQVWHGEPWLCPRGASPTPAGGPLWRTLAGHTASVEKVAVADGQVISGSDDHTLRVWDLASGECQYVLHGHTHRVWVVAVAGGQVISGSFDCTPRVWDLASGECQHVLEGHTDWVTAVAVEDRRVISGSKDHTLRVWDLESGQCQHILRGHTSSVLAVVVTDGWVVSGSDDHTLRVWDLASGECQLVLEGHSGPVRAVAVADGWVVSGSDDHTLRVWDLASGECQHVLEGHTDWVRAVAVADGRVVSRSGDYDHALRVWDLESGQCQHVLRGHTSSVLALAVADGRVISGSHDGTVRVWDLESGQCQHILEGHSGPVWAVAVADGRVISGSGDGTVRVWDFGSPQRQPTLHGHTNWVLAVVVTDGRVISGSFDRTVQVWDLATGECQHVLHGHNDTVWVVAVAGGQVISGSTDDTLRVWDLESGQCQHVLRGHTSSVLAVVVAGGQVISGSTDGTLRVWDLASGECQHVLRGHTSSVLALGVAGTRVISGSGDGTLRVWDLVSGECQLVLEGHSGPVWAMVVAGGRVISGSEDGTLRVWDLASGERRLVLEGHTDRVRFVAVAEGRVISGSFDGTVRVWDLASGECQYVLHGHTSSVRVVAVAGGRVISGLDDHTLRVWDLESGQEVAQWEGDAIFEACDAMVLDTGAEEDRPSLIIAAGDRGGHVQVLELRGDRETAKSKPKSVGS